MKRSLLIKATFAFLILGFALWLFFCAGFRIYELKSAFELFSRIVGVLYAILSVGIFLGYKKSLKAVGLLGIFIVPCLIAYAYTLYGYMGGYFGRFLIGLFRSWIITPFIPTFIFALATFHPAIKDAFLSGESGYGLASNHTKLVQTLAWIAIAAMLVLFFANSTTGWVAFKNTKLGFQIKFPPKWECKNLCSGYDDCSGNVVFCYEDPFCYVKVSPQKIISYSQFYDSSHFGRYEEDIDIARKKTFNSGKIKIIKENIPVSSGQTDVTRLIAIEDMVETVKFPYLAPAKKEDVLLWKKGQIILEFAEIFIKNNYYYIILQYDGIEDDLKKCAVNHAAFKKIVSTFKPL